MNVLMQRTGGIWRTESAMGLVFVVAPAARLARGERYDVAMVGDMFNPTIQANARLLAAAPALLDLAVQAAALKIGCVGNPAVGALASQARALLVELEKDGA